MKDKFCKELFEREKRDFESAKLLHNQKKYFDEVIFLAHQATGNMYKAF